MLTRSWLAITVDSPLPESRQESFFPGAHGRGMVVGYVPQTCPCLCHGHLGLLYALCLVVVLEYGLVVGCGMELVGRHGLDTNGVVFFDNGHMTVNVPLNRVFRRLFYASVGICFFQSAILIQF